MRLKLRVRGTIGLRLPNAFRILTGCDDRNRAAEYSLYFVRRADEIMIPWTRLYSEVPATLKALRQGGVRVAIISSKFRYRIAAIREKSRLLGEVDVIVGGENVREHKPHPEGLHYALNQLRVDASHSVYVGDHPLDAEAAARADLAFVAVRTGQSRPDTWMVLAPLGVVDNVSGLLRLVECPVPQSREVPTDGGN